jgi:hypothetical protein
VDARAALTPRERDVEVCMVAPAVRGIWRGDCNHRDALVQS